MKNPLVLRRVVTAGLVLLLLALVFLLMLAWTPWFKNLSPDSGLFAYGGKEILSGRLLYRDIWDNKPPGVFYLNALAQIPFGSTPWAQWWLQLASISATVVIFFLILRRLTGLIPGLLASLTFLLTMMYPDYYLGGNFTETYALLPQVLVIGAAAAYFASDDDRWFTPIGLLSAAAFLFKPTYIALGMAALVVGLYRVLRAREGRRAVKISLHFGLGGLILLGPVILYWAAQGALWDLLFATIIYNQQYVQENLTLGSLLGTARVFLVVQPLAAVSVLTIAAAGLFLGGRLRGRLELPQDSPSEPESLLGGGRGWLLAAVLLAVPLEVAFVSISGRNFGHYFVTPLPAMTTAIAFLFAQLGEWLRGWREKGAWPLVVLALVVGVGAGWLFEVLAKETPRSEHLQSLAQLSFQAEYELNSLDRFVVEHSGPEESVLVWGNHPGINFRTGRRYPSRYPFAMHLVTPSPAGVSRFDQFLQDIYQDPPALILAQPESSAGIPFFGQVGADLCPLCPPEARQGLEELQAYVDAHYTPVEQIGEWLIYARGTK